MDSLLQISPPEAYDAGAAVTPLFADEKNEARRSQRTCPVPQSEQHSVHAQAAGSVFALSHWAAVPSRCVRFLSDCSKPLLDSPLSLSHQFSILFSPSHRKFILYSWKQEKSGRKNVTACYQ